MNLHSKEKYLILALLVCALVVTFGYSFAYFTTGVVVSSDGKNGVSASTQELQKVTYDAGSKLLSLIDAYPGMKANKKFSITLEPSGELNSATWAIKLNISSNDFEKCSEANYDATSNACTKDAEELVYTLKSGDTILATGDITDKVGEIELFKDTKTVDVETSFDYVLELEFKDSKNDQNHNLNKSLVATLNVMFAE